VVFRKGNSSLELQRGATGWKILRPLNAPADDAAVEDLLSKIHALRLESFELTGKPESADDSRGDSSVEAQFFTSNGESPFSIRLAVAPTGGPATAHLDARKISGTVSANASALLAPSIESLRDTALLRINLDLVDIIRVEDNGTPRDITRTREGWSDKTQNIQDIAKNLARVKVDTRLPATPSEIEKCGLNNPLKRISFLSVLSENTPEAIAGEYVIARLSVGTALPDGSIPVLVEGTPEIRLVSGEIRDLLP
jgi:hypothetical protein